MALLERAPSSSCPQRAKRPNIRKASISAQASERTHITKNRPFGAGVQARIARAEAFAGLLMDLKDCANLERRCGAVIVYNERTRSKLQSIYARSEISFETFERHMLALDKVDSRIAVNLIRHAERVRSVSIPDAQRSYDLAESAA